MLFHHILLYRMSISLSYTIANGNMKFTKQAWNVHPFTWKVLTKLNFVPALMFYYSLYFEIITYLIHYLNYFCLFYSFEYVKAKIYSLGFLTLEIRKCTAYVQVIRQENTTEYLILIFLFSETDNLLFTFTLKTVTAQNHLNENDVNITVSMWYN